jgi:hypothetical protein
MIHQLWHGLKGGKHAIHGGFYSPKNMKNPLGQRLGTAARTGWDMSFKGNMILAAPMAAFAFASAPEGRKVSTATGALASGVGAFVGGALFGLPGAVVGGFIGDELASSAIGKAMGRMHDLPRDRARVNFTTGFQDSDAAFTMRQRAAHELSGSLMNARQYLGGEGAFLHS